MPEISSIIESQEIGNINTHKKIFAVIFTGGEENVLLQKILKPCEIFQACRYPVPRSSEIQEEIKKIAAEIKEKKI